MTNAVPHHRPHQSEDMSELQRDLARALDAGMTTRVATPPPADRKAPTVGERGAHLFRATSPSENRITSPLEQLLEVVDETYRLQQLVEALCTAVTGQQATPLRLRDVGAPQCGLLPNVARLSQEISSIHRQIERRIGEATRAVT